jgi:hypothetical protein
MKSMSTARQPSEGTLIVEKCRKRMNNYTDAQRQELLERALARVYATPNVPVKTHSRSR